MVSVIKRKIRGKEYYSLQYSYRESANVKNLYKEIGKQLPKNLEAIKEEFINEIFQKIWQTSIEALTNKYRKKFDSLPSPIQIKDLKTFGIKFTYHSNKIEGSTLTLREVALVVEEPKVSINKPTHDIIEAKLHMEIYEKVISSNSHIELTIDMINEWHRKLFSLHPDRDAFAGLIREEGVLIAGSNHVPPKDPKPYLIELFNWYNENKASMHPVLLSCLMHLRFVKIHPYLDGNGRMCRLVQNYILFKHNYPMYALPYKIRKSYYKAIEKSVLKEDEMTFVGWFFRNYLKYAQDLIT